MCDKEGIEDPTYTSVEPDSSADERLTGGQDVGGLNSFPDPRKGNGRPTRTSMSSGRRRDGGSRVHSVAREEVRSSEQRHDGRSLKKT